MRKLILHLIISTEAGGVNPAVGSECAIAKRSFR